MTHRWGCQEYDSEKHERNRVRDVESGVRDIVKPTCVVDSRVHDVDHEPQRCGEGAAGVKASNVVDLGQSAANAEGQCSSGQCCEVVECIDDILVANDNGEEQVDINQQRKTLQHLPLKEVEVSNGSDESSIDG